MLINNLPQVFWLLNYTEITNAGYDSTYWLDTKMTPCYEIWFFEWFWMINHGQERVEESLLAIITVRYHTAPIYVLCFVCLFVFFERGKNRETPFKGDVVRERVSLSFSNENRTLFQTFLNRPSVISSFFLFLFSRQRDRASQGTPS